MTAATSATMNLPEKSVSWIQDLIQINLDSRDGFKDAAQHLKDEHSTLEAMFRRLGAERDAQAKELQTLVAKNAEKPQKSGSATAAVHRAWMDLRSRASAAASTRFSAKQNGVKITSRPSTKKRLKISRGAAAILF